MNPICYLKKLFVLLVVFLFMVNTTYALNFRFVYSPDNSTVFPQNLRTGIENAGQKLGSYIANNHTVTVLIKSEYMAGQAGTAENKQALISNDSVYIALSGIYTINATEIAKPNRGPETWETLSIHELLHILGISSDIRAFANLVTNDKFTGKKLTQMNNGTYFPLAGDRSEYTQKQSHLIRYENYKFPVDSMQAAIINGGGRFSILDLAILSDIGYTIPIFNTITSASQAFPLPAGTVSCQSYSSPCEEITNAEPNLYINDEYGQIEDNSTYLCVRTKYSVNGGPFTSEKPIYSATTPLTIVTKLICINDSNIESRTKTFNTYPICPKANNIKANPVTIIDRKNGIPGKIIAPVSNCPPGSKLNYKLTTDIYFNEELPIYDQSKPITIATACFCNRTSSMLLGTSNSITTNPDITAVAPMNITEITINGKKWMNKNLDSRVFQNGEAIPFAVNMKQWDSLAALKSPACCAVDFNDNNTAKYGLIYNAYALNSPKGIALKGWRVPTTDEIEPCFFTSNMGYIKSEWTLTADSTHNEYLYSKTDAEFNASGFSAIPNKEITGNLSVTVNWENPRYNISPYVLNTTDYNWMYSGVDGSYWTSTPATFNYFECNHIENYEYLFDNFQMIYRYQLPIVGGGGMGNRKCGEHKSFGHAIRLIKE